MEEVDLTDLSRKGKFARCIICSDYSLRSRCHNIFETTLTNGDILLSEFLKNVLDCSVFIVVSPEFFICDRCYILCHNLDCSFARCNILQDKIRTLFLNTETRLKRLREGKPVIEDLDSLEPDPQIKKELEEDLYVRDVGVDLRDEEYYEDEPLVAEEVEDVPQMDPDFFVNTEIVESEVVVGDSEYIPEVEKSEAKTEVSSLTQVEVEPPQILKYEDQSQDGVVICEKCGLVLESEKALKKHKKTHLELKDQLKIKSVYEFQHFSVKLKKKKKVFFCNRCKYEASTSEDMEKHLKTHKTEPEYMCDICGRRFKYLKTFERHKNVHDESRPFACKFCAYRAMTELLLKIHERQHDDQKKYVCSKCGYKTLKKMSYIIHCRIHTGERPYCCPTCPYKAKDPSTLERHRRIHGGIRRYHCTLCNYKSVQKAALDIHMRMHTGEKPFACTQCEYRSANRHNLKAHIAAIHSDERPFACTQCSYRTKLKRLLTLHTRKHTDEKPYTCAHCGAKFRYRSAMSYHVSKKHPAKENGEMTCYVLNYCESQKLKFNGEDLVFSEADSDSGSDNETVYEIVDVDDVVVETT
ncbi:gastrula zinc finger protein XlCGF57.1-like [Macrosteles quadrilineatus]|uniref:gastrula zinc finger protein XlCGF57.1-like n=1 Tax=Macrosteles quadrilineatus TaxID=74068 RepID=UPI0023E16A3E|nr:gastrula zinc finger protein XlCGF57.1-like [Macrosteles quadrilineatus]